MDGHTFPGRNSDPADFIFVASIVEHAKTLEDIIVGIFARSEARLTLTSLDDDERRLMGMVTLPSGSDVYIAFPEKTIRKGRKLFDPRTALTALADVGTIIVDPDWLERRDKTYGITVYDTVGVAMVRPTHAIDLVLSYALSENGQVNISRDFGSLEHGHIGHKLDLQLIFLGGENSAGYEETVSLNWEKLVARTSKTHQRSEGNRLLSSESR